MFRRPAHLSVLFASGSAIFPRVLGLLAFFILAASLSRIGGTNAQNSVASQNQMAGGAIPTLEVEKPIERELAGGQIHVYQLTFQTAQYVKVVVEQRGIDVVATLFGQDGNQIAEFDGVTGNQGRETIENVAEAAGSYRLTVQTKLKEAPLGRYEIRLTELRVATEKDLALQEARKLVAEAIKLNRAGKYDEACPPAERALELRERVLAPEHPAVTSSVNILANLYRDKGEYVKAAPLYQRTLAIWEKSLGPEHLNIAQSLNGLATLYWRKGDYAKAEPLYQRALSMSEKALGPGHPDVATTLINLANLYRDKDDYTKAEPLYQRALAIQEKALGLEHPDLGASFNNLAGLYHYKGDYARAEPLYQRALGIWEKALGPEHPDVAHAIYNLANLYRGRGDYVRAEPLHQRALAIREKTLGPEHHIVGQSLNDLANLYRDKGDFTKAEQLYQRAIAVQEKTLGAENRELAQSLNNLANLYYAKTDYAKAEPLYQRALAIQEKMLGPEHLDLAQLLGNFANLYSDKGDYAKAEPLYLRSLAIMEKRLGQEHRVVAVSLNNLALLYRDKGDYVKAELYHLRSLAIREKILGPEHPAVANCLNDLAVLHERKDEIIQAINFKARARAVSERNIALNLATGSERQKLAYLAKFSEESDHTVSLHIRSAPTSPAARNLALTTILQRKGRSLDAMTDSFAALRRRAQADDRSLLDKLQETNTQLARLVLNGPQRVTPTEHQSKIKSLEEQKERLEADISVRSAEFRAQVTPVRIETVQQAIPSRAALVEFFAYRPFNAKYTKLNEQFGPRHYVAYVLGPQGAPQSVELGEVKVIDTAMEKLRRALREPHRGDVKRLARKLDMLVMQPVRALLGSTRRVFVSPDGALNLVPFSALVDEQNLYLIERYKFSYLTSGRDLLRLQVKQEGGQETVVLANPDFGKRAEMLAAADRDIKPVYDAAQGTGQIASANPYLADAYFPSLPGTAGEAAAIKTIVPSARVLTKAQATETALKQISHPRVLHIATHGFFLRDTAGDTGGRIDDPSLRSGLALAGANLRKSGNDDGILTALETAGLDLWGTRLAVLSACNTGVGDVRNGDGVYGLRRALVLAGSESQVMSLWRVSDQGTKELMVEYYKRLLRGEGRGEALRQVQLQMLKDPRRRHPYYWASFIQSGEWANLDGKR